MRLCVHNDIDFEEKNWTNIVKMILQAYTTETTRNMNILLVRMIVLSSSSSSSSSSFYDHHSHNSDDGDGGEFETLAYCADIEI